MPDGAPEDERFGDVLHFDGGLHPRDNAALLEFTLQREAVDHSGEHSHVIRGRAIHAAMTGGEAAPDIAAADDNRNLHAEVVDLLHLPRNFLNDLRRDRVAPACFSERFTA